MGMLCFLVEVLIEDDSEVFGTFRWKYHTLWDVEVSNARTTIVSKILGLVHIFLGRIVDSWTGTHIPGSYYSYLGTHTRLYLDCLGIDNVGIKCSR